MMPVIFLYFSRKPAIMKPFIFFLLFFAQLLSVSTALAGDTSYVLLRIHGNDQIAASWDKGNYLEHQFITALQRELRKKELLVLPWADSQRVSSPNLVYIIEINILEAQVNEPITNQRNNFLSRNVHTNTYKDETEDLHKVEATVTAEMIVTEKQVTAILRMRIAVIKLPEAVTSWSELVVESYKWENKSATYTGSVQALTNKELELIRAKPKPIPRQDEVYKEIVKQCVIKSTAKIAAALH